MTYMIELATDCGDSKLLGYTGGTPREAQRYAKRELTEWVRSLYQDGTPIAAGYEINRPGESYRSVVRPLAEKWFCFDKE